MMTIYAAPSARPTRSRHRMKRQAAGANGAFESWLSLVNRTDDPGLDAFLIYSAEASRVKLLVRHDRSQMI